MKPEARLGRYFTSTLVSVAEGVAFPWMVPTVRSINLEDDNDERFLSKILYKGLPEESKENIAIMNMGLVPIFGVTSFVCGAGLGPVILSQSDKISDGMAGLLIGAYYLSLVAGNSASWLYEKYRKTNSQKRAIVK